MYGFKLSKIDRIAIRYIHQRCKAQPIMFKYQLLKKFIDTNAGLPEQGTDEWKKLRLNFIGGSEIASVIKQNKNKSTNKLIMDKLGFDRFTGNVVTHWGNVFEENIRRYCEDVFMCSIKETGSIPFKHGILSYSPDGLAVVPTLSLQSNLGMVEGIDTTSPTQLVLFEFKCPHSRIASDEIPEYYLPQVNIGMNIIDIMETAVFVQATYRRCRFEDLMYNTAHNNYGHFKRPDISKNPVECGFMIIYSEEDDDVYRDMMESIDDVCEYSTVDDVMDMGTLYESSIFEEIMGNCVNHTFKVDYSIRMTYHQRIFSERSYTRELYNKDMQISMMRCLNEKLSSLPNVVGVLPFKLLSVHTTSVPKNPKYIQDTDAFNRAKQVLQCIEDHRGMDNKAEVMKSVRRYKL